MYLLISLVYILIFIIIKDKRKALKLVGILTITSSLLLIVLTSIAKLLINNWITMINISAITNHIFIKFIYTSLILFLLGLIEIIISKYLHIKKRVNT